MEANCDMPLTWEKGCGNIDIGKICSKCAKAILCSVAIVLLKVEIQCLGRERKYLSSARWSDGVGHMPRCHGYK